MFALPGIFHDLFIEIKASTLITLCLVQGFGSVIFYLPDLDPTETTPPSLEKIHVNRRYIICTVD